MNWRTGTVYAERPAFGAGRPEDKRISDKSNSPDSKYRKQRWI